MAKKRLALIRQRLNVTTTTGYVTLLENAGHQGISGIEMEMVQEGMHQWIHLLQMPYRESDVDDSPVNDRFKTGEGFHAIPPPYTGNYMPSRPNLSFVGLDDSVYKTKVSETKTSISKTSKDIVEKPKTVRPSAPIIKDWDTNSDNDINTAKQSSPRAVASISTARPVNTDALKPKVNDALPTTCSYFKAHSPVNNVTTTGPKAVVSAAVGNGENAGKSSACWIWRPIGNGNPQYTLQDQGIFDSRCSRHMTGNKSFLTDYQEIHGGFVAFGGSPKGGKITKKYKIRTGKLDFEDVYFVKELKFNLFSVSQMCDKKNSVLFTETECLVLSPDFKLLDESQVLLKVPRQNNMYSFDLKNVVPSGGLTCLFVKATIDESNLWHRRLGHINFKTMNKLVRGNLVRGLPSKLFENDHSCVACQKGKQHKASCKTKLVSSISHPLQMLHMDLFGPTFVRSINHKIYCLVVTDDYSRFSWVFFLATKDETSGILKTFITGIENQINHKVKIIRCDNGTEFKNNDMNQFCGMKGIKREFSVARTPQQNGVAERKNRTLIEAARTMLADSLLPTTFWAEAVNTACYVQNRVLVTKPHNKTPYELLHGRPPSISFMRPFGCPVNILNTLDPLGKLDEKANEGFFVGYSINRKDRSNQVIFGLCIIYEVRCVPDGCEECLLYGTIKEEVYVCQPPSFEDTQFPDKVYKVEKALYSLHQAPRAWYETLSTYLSENGFRRGIINKTLFIKKDKGDILLVQVYVDDIIFGSTKKSLCTEFESLMHKKF
ncbi:putative ribonuclease H-like domain-containing protein [Tanacetum coccineum]